MLIKSGYNIFLINDLEIRDIFKGKDRKEGVSVMDFINRIVQVLKKDLKRLAISTQNTGLIEPVKL